MWKLSDESRVSYGREYHLDNTTKSAHNGTINPNIGLNANAITSDTTTHEFITTCGYIYDIAWNREQIRLWRGVIGVCRAPLQNMRL